MKYSAYARPKGAFGRKDMEHSRKGAIAEIEEHRAAFSLAFIALFALTFAFLALLCATPNPLGEQSGGDALGAPVAERGEEIKELPVRVIGEAVGLDVSVNNPTSTDIETLDKALLSGAVRYPTSAWLGQEGSLLVFGHSSYLPLVRNQAYKAFNDIQKFSAGDTVKVRSATIEYRYKVVSVRLADATEDSIEFPPSGKHLVLVTCDSFGKKTERFIVTADFTGAYLLTN